MTEQDDSKNTEKNSAESPPSIGLDMAPTIAWYEAEENELLLRLPRVDHEITYFDVQDLDLTSLTKKRVTAIASLFPFFALTRSTLNSGAIIGKLTLFFARGSTPSQLKTTHNPKEAISPTAIIPSYTDNSRWKETGIPSSDVFIYQIPPEISPNIAEIIHTQALVHEIAHTLVDPALYGDNYRLQLPYESLDPVDGFKYLMDFAEMAEKYNPVSHYSSFYRKPGEEFKTNVAIAEEFVETIAARLLNFVYCDDPVLRFDPLSDRPEIAGMVDDFLEARKA